MNIRGLIFEGLIQHHVHKSNDRRLIANFLKNLQCLRFLVLGLNFGFLLKPISSAHSLNQFIIAFGIGILIIDQLGNRQRIRHTQLQRAIKLIGQVIQSCRVQWIGQAQVQCFPI